jgi:hypothetical protein
MTEGERHVVWYKRRKRIVLIAAGGAWNILATLRSTSLVMIMTIVLCTSMLMSMMEG